jgi:NTP pyrophosphatase (non-canonical NTP hydrolase)
MKAPPMRGFHFTERKDMNTSEYMSRAMRLASDLGHEHNMTHAVLGITSEAGEIADQYKKFIAYGKALDRQNMLEEMGDCLWFLTLLAKTMGFTIDQVMDFNIAKLEARYPDLKFNADHALNRDKAGEMAAGAAVL